MLARHGFRTTLIWLALAAAALLASAWTDVDLRLIAAGCVGIAVLSGSASLLGGSPKRRAP